MRLTFLGTGTSFGVPVVGCRCGTCTSSDPRDRRTRHGALLELPGGQLLVDTPPELRLQLLAAGVDRIDAVWFTHAHADHVHGIDDLRIFTIRGGNDVMAWAPPWTGEELHRRFRYIFDRSLRVEPGTSRPQIHLRSLPGRGPVELLGARFVPLYAPHGPVSVVGFRVGALGYITDAKSLPDEALRALEGVEVLVLNALWWGDPHPTHFSIEEAIAASRRVGARQTWLTHLTHRVGHAALLETLPPDVRPAFDGLRIDLPDPPVAGPDPAD